MGEEPADDEVNNSLQLVVPLVELPRAIAVLSTLLDLVGRHAEEEEVFGTHFLADFHIGAVQGADG